MEENKEVLEVQLFSTINEYEIDEVCAVLSDNNIPYIRKDDGTGSYINLYMGQSIQEKRVFVRQKDYDKSLELISLFISNDLDTEETVEEEQVIYDENNKYTLIKRGLGFLILGMPLLAIILLIIASLLY